MSVEGLKDFEVVSKSGSKKEKHARHSFFHAVERYLLMKLLNQYFDGIFLETYNYPTFPNESS